MKFRSCQIKSEQVRLLLFKECDWRGRKLLFDSSTIERVPVLKNEKYKVCHADETPCVLEVSEGFTYLYKGPAADASILGEMIFGAVAINSKSVSLKIHIMDEPRRLMCTKVFCVPASRKSSRADRRTSDVNMNSRSSGNFGNSAKPLNVPLLKEEGVSLSFAIDRGDSGFCGDVSPYSSVGSTYDYFSMFDVWGNNTPEEIYSFHSPPGRKLSTCSNGSWQRRTFQNLATKFDMGHRSCSSNLLSVPTVTSSNTISDSQVFSGSSTSGTCDSLLSAPIKKNKLGLALLFTVGDSSEMDLLRRCVEHSPQLQALVCRLRLATLTAGAGSGFVSTLYRAASDAARWLTDLMYGPRLQPMWLNVATKDAKLSNSAAESLLSDLCSVLSVGDTKSTNFFISTLLTHVLTYHLGWVTTVSPYDVVDPQNRLELTTEIIKPYNVLWAQLSDLCGCIGFPPRSAKTVIRGKANTNFINRLLLVLTYFFRCGDVKRMDFQYQEYALSECMVAKDSQNTLKRVSTRANNLEQFSSPATLKVPTVNAQNSDSSVSTLVGSDASIKNSPTLADFNKQLSKRSEFDGTQSAQSNDNGLKFEAPVTGQLKRNQTVIMTPKSADSSLCSSVSEELETEQNVVFVLGDDEKLVGLKNKSNGGKCVKKTKMQNESNEIAEKKQTCAKDKCDSDKRAGSPSKCCGSTLQHSKPIKHSGFKFEFDKYPQIVTNYMKSKNLELLDRHYIGKPGNLKLDNYQFDPTIVPPIQEERCEACYKCQLMESMLQTPTNASEMEYMNDLPQQELQYAREVVVQSESRESTPPKTFVRKRVENTVVVNIVVTDDVKSAVLKPAEVNCNIEKANEVKLDNVKCSAVKIDEVILAEKLKLDEIKSVELKLGEVTSVEVKLDEAESAEMISGDVKSSDSLVCKPACVERKKRSKGKEKLIEVKQIIELPVPPLCLQSNQQPVGKQERSGFDVSLLGGVTDHYVPDLILQGTISISNAWEYELRRDLELTTYLNKTLDPPIQAVAIIGDTSNWEVRVLGGDNGTGGMSSLVSAMLEALPAMRSARVPAAQCLLFLESKLREFCILSKTLADMLMSTDFCDIATLTKALNIDVNDVPLLLAIATTHTPQVATRYGISYR
ncbi:hypothetical protein ACJJTC_008952 [Scirpophaga incertulas]